MEISIPTMEEIAQLGEMAYCQATDYATRNGQDLIKGFIVSSHGCKKAKGNFLGCEPQRKRFVTIDKNYYYGVRPVIRIPKYEEDRNHYDSILIQYIQCCLLGNIPIEIGKHACNFGKNYSKERYHQFCEERLLLGNGCFQKKTLNELSEIETDDKNSFFSAVNTVPNYEYRKSTLLEKGVFDKKPIRWIYDEKQNILISEKTIFGVSLDRKLKELEMEWDVDSKHFVNEPVFYQYLLRKVSESVIEDIEQLEEIVPSLFAFINKNRPTLAQECHLEFGEELSCREKIENAINANIPVFLHGKPGEGKSARAREIDPDCTTLELALAPVEDLAGINVYFNHKLQKKKPEWLEELEKKCSDEPEKNHILFLDELTNAMPTIQQLAYSLILDHRVANEWDLPQNVRIIAAGNEVEDSIAASEMPEPLKDRFAHVNVHTSVAEWIEWATHHDIHPAIISYITYRGENALRSAKVEGEISTTPRTWERASKMLQATNDVRFLSPIIGDCQSADFISFCQMSFLDKGDILNGMIGTSVFQNKDIAVKMAMVRGLTDVSMEEFETVRNFVKYAGRESLALFENLWISQKKEEENERMDKVEELHMLDDEY